MKKLFILLSSALIFGYACDNPASPPSNSQITVKIDFDRTKFSKQQDIDVLLRKTIKQNDSLSYENIEETKISKDSNDNTVSISTSKMLNGQIYTAILSGRASDECNITSVESKDFGTSDVTNGSINITMENYQSTLLGCPSPSPSVK